MTEPDVAAQAQHVPFLEHVPDEPVALAQTQPAAVVGHDARGILASVLQHGERVVERLIDGFLSDDSDDSTHVSVT